MKIKTGIQLASLATTLGWIEKKDWKTPKILFVGYRKTVTKKTINNATKQVILSSKNWLTKLTRY